MTSSKSSNDLLPKELLGEIFGHISRFEDRKRINLVCYSWRNAIIFRYGENTRYAYFEDSVFHFFADLQNYPSLQDKVISLTINPQRYKQFGSSNSFMRYILPQCPKLEILKLNINPSNHTYVTKWKKMAHLPRLKQLDMNYMSFGSEDYIDIMEKLRGSLTHLNLMVDRPLISSLDKKNIRNISCYIDSFAPSLEYLRLRFYDSRLNNQKRSIDLPHLLAKHNGLESLKIDGSLTFCECLAGDLDNNIILRDMSNYDSLKILEVDVAWMNVWRFKFITKKLLKLQRLIIQVTATVTVGYLSTSPEKVENIIEGLRAFCKGIKGQVSVVFQYQRGQGLVKPFFKVDYHTFTGVSLRAVHSFCLLRGQGEQRH